MAKKYNGSSWVDCADRVLGSGTDTATSFPVTLRTAAAGNVDYKIYGNTGGAGIETANIYDKNATDTSKGYEADKRIAASTGAAYNSGVGVFITEYIPIEPDTVYTLDGMVNPVTGSVAAPGICFYDASKEFLSGVGFTRQLGNWIAENKQVTTPPDAAFCRFNISYNSAATAMLTRTDTAPASYIPHGYLIPISVSNGTNSTNYALYIGDGKLGEEEYMDYGEGKVYKRNPASFLWFQAFADPQSDKRFLYSIAWTEADRPNLQSDVGFVALRGQEQIITHETAGVSAIGIDQERISDYLYKSGTIRDLGEGCNFRTFVKIGDEYFYGENLHITYDEIVAAPDEEILLDRPAVVLPTDPPAPFPALTLAAGDNALSFGTTVQPEKAEATFTGWHDATARSL